MITNNRKSKQIIRHEGKPVTLQKKRKQQEKKTNKKQWWNYLFIRFPTLRKKNERKCKENVQRRQKRNTQHIEKDPFFLNLLSVALSSNASKRSTLERTQKSHSNNELRESINRLVNIFYIISSVLRNPTTPKTWIGIVHLQIVYYSIYKLELYERCDTKYTRMLQCFQIEYESYCCCLLFSWHISVNRMFIPYRTRHIWTCESQEKRTNKHTHTQTLTEHLSRFLPFFLFSYFQICHILISINLSMEWRNDICQCRHVSNLIFSAFSMCDSFKM